VIVRILGEGQFELDAATFGQLETFDKSLDDAMAKNDDAAFATGLSHAIALVHEKGQPLEVQVLTQSDLALPAAGMTLDEVRKLLSSETVAI